MRGARFGEGVVEDSEEFFDFVGFGEVGEGAGREESLDLARCGVGADDDDGDGRGCRVLAELLEDLLAGDVREVQVEEDEGGLVLPCEVEAEASLHGRNDFDVVSPGHDALHEFEVRKVVFDVEQRLAVPVRGLSRLPLCVVAVQAFVTLNGSFDEWQLDPERTSLPGGAFEVDAAAHCFGEPSRQCESDAGAFDVGSFGAETFEGYEQSAEVLGPDAGPGVGDGDTQACRRGLVAGR